MVKIKRLLIGVVTSRADEPEQKHIFEGIIRQAQKLNIDIAVFSNLYSPVDNNTPYLVFENRIYNLIESKRLDGIIIIAESILNSNLLDMIISKVRNLEIPSAVIGGRIKGFRCFNTDDIKDIENITNHLIEVHGFKNIDIITGSYDNDFAKRRVEGYRNALESHGIEFKREKVHYGNFWTNSGEDLADNYADGKIPMPEAVVCTNDYMAFGLLDRLSERNIKVPEDITVIGYEYIEKRIYHNPLLTTYQRNRRQLGADAVCFLYEKIKSVPCTSGIVFDEGIIYGNSCSCGTDLNQINYEFKILRTEQDYNLMYDFDQFDKRLVECHSMEDYIYAIEHSAYLVRNAFKIYLCLYESWSESPYFKSEKNQDTDLMSCYYIKTPKNQGISGNAVTFYDKSLFPDYVADKNYASAFYFAPVFFTEETFGYAIIEYNCPDGYDSIFRKWIRTVSNALETIRMKNDIQYLLRCRNLSETYDTLTGLYNEKNFRKVFHIASENSSSDDELIFIMMKINIFSGMDKTDPDIIKDIADCLKIFVKRKSEFAGRINEDILIFAGYEKYPENTAETIKNSFLSAVFREKSYMQKYGINHFAVFSTQKKNQNISYHNIIDEGLNEIRRQTDNIKKITIQPRYSHYLKIRNYIYMNPFSDISSDNMCRKLCISESRFRAVYRQYFGISFHQDCIHSKMYTAKYLLFTTDMNISDIALQCGYSDIKYFIRQFHKYSGCTPSNYRSIMNYKNPER